jgi:hypothetical protein
VAAKSVVHKFKGPFRKKGAAESDAPIEDEAVEETTDT